MTKIRRFTIVLHDAQKGNVTKQMIANWLEFELDPKEYVIAEEPYNHQEGTHIHIFLNLKNPRNFFKMLENLQEFWPHGRVQIDKAYGTMAQGCQYLQDAPKDKKYDPSPIYFPSRDISLTEVEKAHKFFVDLCVKFMKKKISDPSTYGLLQASSGHQQPCCRPCICRGSGPCCYLQDYFHQVRKEESRKQETRPQWPASPRIRQVPDQNCLYLSKG